MNESISCHAHSPWPPLLVGICSATLNLSSTNIWLKHHRIRRIYAPMHSFVIKASQIFLPLPRTTGSCTACLHATLRAVATIVLDVAHTKALSRLFIWIPRIQTTGPRRLSVGQYLAPSSFQYVLSLPSLRWMI